MTPRAFLIPAGLLLLAGSLACKPKPSEAFIEQVKATLHTEEQPGFTLTMGLPMEGGATKSSDLRPLAEVMANRLGFRIEVSTPKKPSGSVTYAFQAFKAPTLPGLTFRQDGTAVKILTDAHWDMVIESLLPPKEGFESTLGREKTAAEREKEIAEATALGLKDATTATDANITFDKEKRKEKAEAFAKAVERYCTDNGFKRAWFVTYRKKFAGTLPKDSPFWAMVDAWSKASSGQLVPLMPNAAALAHAQWLDKRGEVEVKESLTEYCLVAFEKADGTLAKTEGWKAFVTE
jgi:hypothetical protein